MTDRTISKGLHPSVTAVVVARPEIGPYHLKFARDKRAAGVGWQAIAHMLGVNREDIQRAIGSGLGMTDGAEPPPPPAPPKPPPTSPDPAPGSMGHLMLAALKDLGEASIATLAPRVARNAHGAKIRAGQMRDLGWVDYSRGDLLRLTRLGCEVLARVEAAQAVAKSREDRGANKRRRVDRVLLALADGMARSAEISNALGLAVQSVSNDLRSLEERKFAKPIRREGRVAFVWTPTAQGLARAAEIRSEMEPSERKTA